MCRCGFCFKYGEVFIEERNGSWNTPYLFNDKFINALTPQATHIHNLHSTLHTTPWKVKTHQPLAPLSALPPHNKTRPNGSTTLIPNSSFLTPQLAPTGQKHFLFGIYGVCYIPKITSINPLSHAFLHPRYSFYQCSEALQSNCTLRAQWIELCYLAAW